MRRGDESEFEEFATAQMDRLRRTAYLLCRDWHAADDLVGITLLKVYRNWSRVTGAYDMNAYVRGMLTRAWLDEHRRPWRREDSTETIPDVSAPAVAHDVKVADQQQIRAMLDRLAPRQRAAVVLRFYCDLSVEQTAEILGVSPGTVKSQTARGLETLRGLAGLTVPLRQESS